MDNKEYLKIVSFFATLDNTYKSNVSDEELLIVKSFLLLMRKKGLLKKIGLDFHTDDYKIIIEECIKNCDNQNIKELYYSNFQSIIKSVRKPYLVSLYKAYLSISDSLIENHSKEFFDDQIQFAFTTRKILDYSNSIQPAELTSLLNSFCDEKSVSDYYNPFAGLASLGLDLPEHINYVAEEINEYTWLLGKLRSLIYNRFNNFNYSNKNSFLEWTSNKETKYDFIGFYPPLNLKLDKHLKQIYNSEYFQIGNANPLIISECFKKLKDKGKMAFVMSSGFLFSSSKKDVSLKKSLVENGYIDKIILLPEKIFSYTSIAVNIVVICKNQNKTRRVNFIDASEKFILKDNKKRILDLKAINSLISENKSQKKSLVEQDEILENNYNLSVHRYVFEELNLSILEDTYLTPLVELIKPIKQTQIKTTRPIKVVRIRDLANTALEATKSFNEIEKITPKHPIRILKDNSLLLAILWKSLKPTIYKKNDEDIYYESSSIIACSVNQDKVDINYLLIELQKEYVQKQLDQLSIGASVRRISKGDLMQIKVVVPDLKTQEERKLEFKESIIQEQQTKFEDLKKQLGVEVSDENSFLRHKISGTLRNIRGSYNKLKDIIDNQICKELPEVYEYKVNPKLNTSLKDYLYRLDRDIKSVHRAVKNVGVELTLNDLKFENLNFIKFVQSYVEEVKNRSNNNFEIIINIDEEALKYSKVKEVTFSGDKEILYQVFDNIIENAERHAFSEKKENNRIIVELLYNFEDLEVQLDFTNTGKPLPDDYTYEAFTRKGSTSGKNAGNGIGGWYMYEVMKLHNGNFGFTDETGPEGGIHEDYATTIELTFPIEIKI